MNDGLIDAFKHNAWASRELLGVCAPLTEEQLRSTVPGVHGTIIGTLWHVISAEAGYCSRLTGEDQHWDRRAEDPPSIAILSEYNDELEEHWLRFLGQPFDAERLLLVPWINDEVRDVPAGVVLAQALHHGNEHRSQIATILTCIGIEPPGWGLWEFAEATGRAPIHVD